MRTDATRPEAAAAKVNEEFNMHSVFRIKDTLFSINGSDILSIQQFPEKLLNVPHAPSYLRGSGHGHRAGDQVAVGACVDPRTGFEFFSSP